jgi:Flp pilus assembly protein TadG
MSARSPRSTRRRRGDERGVVAVLVAVALTALLITGGIILDIGLVRVEKNANQSAADEAATAGLQAANNGTGDINNGSAVCTAYQFLVNERTSLRGLSAPSAGVCDGSAPSAICVPGDSSTNVSYHGTTTSGTTRYEVWIKMPYSLNDTSTGGPFRNETYASLSSDPGDATQEGCDQIGVVIKEWDTPGLGRMVSRDDLVSRVRSVARVKVDTSDLAPALLLLDRTHCGVLTVGSGGSPSRIKVSGSGTAPGTIHSDSDASDSACSNGSNSQLFQGKQANGIVAYGTTSGTAGLITSVATQKARAADIVADSPSNVYGTTALNELSTGTPSAVAGRKLVTRRPVDRRYLAGISAATRGASGMWSTNHTAPGFTRSVGCTPTAAEKTALGTMSAADSLYIDCPSSSGFTFTGSITAGTIYVHGFVKGGGLSMPNATRVFIDDTDNNGARINDDALSLSNSDAFCVRGSGCSSTSPSCSSSPTGNPSAKAQLIVRRGRINGGGGLLRLCNTTVILEGGDVGDGTAAKPGGCLPTSWGTPPTSVPCAGTTASTTGGNGAVTTSGSVTVDWTAPNAYDDMNAAGLSAAQQRAQWDGGEDLALWTETAGSGSSMAGGGGLRVRGVFMVPNADPFVLNGGTGQDLTNAQYIVRRFSVGGNATLTMRVDPNNAIPLPSLYDFRMVR